MGHSTISFLANGLTVFESDREPLDRYKALRLVSRQLNNYRLEKCERNILFPIHGTFVHLISYHNARTGAQSILSVQWEPMIAGYYIAFVGQAMILIEKTYLAPTLYDMIAFSREHFKYDEIHLMPLNKHMWGVGHGANWSEKWLPDGIIIQCS